MAQVKNKNTKPELLVRRWLWGNGYRYRLYYKKLPGKPDLVFPKLKKAIFINGCFWHKHNCENFSWPKTNIEFWIEKINSNYERDIRNYEEFEKLGWSVLVIWECELKPKNIALTWPKIELFMSK